MQNNDEQNYPLALTGELRFLITKSTLSRMYLLCSTRTRERFCPARVVASNCNCCSFPSPSSQLLTSLKRKRALALEPHIAFTIVLPTLTLPACELLCAYPFMVFPTCGVYIRPRLRSHTLLVLRQAEDITQRRRACAKERVDG